MHFGEMNPFDALPHRAIGHLDALIERVRVPTRKAARHSAQNHASTIRPRRHHAKGHVTR
jgi:hypothetical protein